MSDFFEVVDADYVVGRKKILFGVNCVFRAGEVTAVLGPNGAGKSTLLRLLSGELRPTSGSVKMLGREVCEMNAKELATRRALMRQAVDITFPITAAEVVRMGILREGVFWDLPEDDSVVRNALERVDMSDFVERDMRSLSGGERQRVLLARALVQVRNAKIDQPCGLLLDEPTSALDLEHQHQTMFLARESAAAGCAVVVVLHDPNLALQYADFVIVLSNGQVCGNGIPSEILSSDFMQKYFRVDTDIHEDSFGSFLRVRGRRR